MRIGIAQIDLSGTNLDESIERMVAQSQRAAAQGVSLLAFPYLCLSSFSPLPEADRPVFRADLLSALEAYAARAECTSVVPVTLDDKDATICDFVLIEGGEVRLIDVCHGAELLGSIDFDARLCKIRHEGLECVFARSYEDAEVILELLDDIDVVFFFEDHGFEFDNTASIMGVGIDKSPLSKCVRSHNVWMVGVGSLGTDNHRIYCGASFVLTPEGKLVAVAPAFEEELLIAEIGDSNSALTPEPYNPPYYVWQALSLGIRSEVSARGLRDVVLLLDGSLASMLLVALCVDALGPLRVRVLDVTDPESTRAKASREVLKRLRVEPIDARKLPALPVRAGGATARIMRAYQLVQLREYARSEKALLLSALSKTELAILGRNAEPVAAELYPFGDMTLCQIVDLAPLRNSISCVLPEAALSMCDLAPELLELKSSCAGPAPQRGPEELIDYMGLLDDIVVERVELGFSRAQICIQDARDPKLLSSVLNKMQESWQLGFEGVPLLQITDKPLTEAGYTRPLRWQDCGKSAFEAEEPSIFDDLLSGKAGFASMSFPEPEEIEMMLGSGSRFHEALSALRELAEQSGFLGADARINMQGVPGVTGEENWLNPFSEN